MMVIWRTATGSQGKYYVLDPKTSQAFFIVTIAEGPSNTLLFGRLKVQNRRISEIELYTNRSRGQGGFQFDPDGPSHFPAAWTIALKPAQRASRAELLKAGESIFNTSIDGHPISTECVLMENGKVVSENPEVAKEVGIPAQPGAAPRPRNPDGTVSIPCGAPPIRPTDQHARTDIVDEEQGVVVSFGVVQGISEPYLATSPTESAFVPYSLLQPYADMLKKQQAADINKSPAIRGMSASGS